MRRVTKITGLSDARTTVCQRQIHLFGHVACLPSSLPSSSILHVTETPLSQVQIGNSFVVVLAPPWSTTSVLTSVPRLCGRSNMASCHNHNGLRATRCAVKKLLTHAIHDATFSSKFAIKYRSNNY